MYHEHSFSITAPFNSRLEAAVTEVQESFDLPFRLTISTLPPITLSKIPRTPSNQGEIMDQGVRLYRLQIYLDLAVRLIVRE